MAPSSKVAKACKAMKDIGISEDTVKPVLKDLLDVYQKNWKLIEDENYRVLIDAIFEREFPKKEETRKHESFETRKHEYLSEDEAEDCEPPLKKYRLRSQLDQSVSPRGNCRPTEETYVSQTCWEQKIDASTHQNIGDKKCETEVVSSPKRYRRKEKRPSEQFSDKRGDESEQLRDDGKVPVPLQFDRGGKRLKHEKGTHSVAHKEPKVTTGVDLITEETCKSEGDADVLGKNHNNAIILKSEGDVDDLIPLAIVLPAPPSLQHGHDSTNWSSSKIKENDLEFLGMKNLNAEVVAAPTLLCEDGSPNESPLDVKGSGLKLLEYNHLDRERKVDSTSADSLQFDIASSPEGDVKISLICNSSGRTDFRIPSLDVIFNLVEEKYIKAYKITEPGFAVAKLMKDVCECFLEEGTNGTDDGEKESFVSSTPRLDLSNKSIVLNVSRDRDDQGDSYIIQPRLPNGPFRFRNLVEVCLPQIPKVLTLNSVDVLHSMVALNEIGNEKTSNSSSLVVFQNHGSNLDPLKAAPSQYVDDITRGEEDVKISLVNEISDEGPPAFYYIPKNIVYHNAYVRFLLARISNENCCSNCFGNCLSLSIPCACAGETGGEFAYTPGGLVEEKFLEKCISMDRDAKPHDYFKCKDCPLERSKNSSLSGPCKGHLLRRFIKECWYKCGCSKKCGNRVVQRGITANLQVFMTPGDKGWGLRTLDDLPKGAFVCEYVGEIVTNMELHERNTLTSERERHTYPVLLDADWVTEGVLKDEEALCLDATNYGNVARFINHRCNDANLMEIPVEVETPDHHYYHLAFFTTRKVDALEELTWDYRIDFEDDSHPVKAFQCRCGSMFCRDVKGL